MKNWFVLWISWLTLIVTLTACQSSTMPIPTPVSTGIPSLFECETPGTVEMGTIEETTRGYPYNYGLYLPPCYDVQLDRLYPLLILIPGRGGSPSDFINAGGLALADQMILNDEIPPFIIVTTEATNSENEKNGESILKELLPAIESQYRVQPERQFRAIAGFSLGGIASYRIVFQHPKQFASGAQFGSGAIAGEEDQIRTWLAAIEQDYLPRFFFDSGEGDPYMLERAKVMAGLLDEASVPYLLHEGDGDHSYRYWMQNMPLYFQWVAEDWE